MTDPILALRKAILAYLSADADLTALLGGARIYETVPRAAQGLYVVFGDAQVRDWSSGGGRGHSHDLTLVIWSKPGGVSPALAVAGRLGALLDDPLLSLDGHRLVLLRVAGEDARRDERADLARVAMRLAALTEVV